MPRALRVLGWVLLALLGALAAVVVWFLWFGPVAISDRAADETALLQAKINAELKNKPLDFNNPGKGTVSQTAFLQHQIDLRRRK